MDELTQKYIAEELRVTIKELGWLRGHLANIYNAIRPANMDEIPADENQLEIDFTEKQN